MCVYMQIFNFRDGHVTTFRHHSGPISAKCLVTDSPVQTSKRHTFRVSAFHRYHWFGVKLFSVGCAQDSQRAPLKREKMLFWIWLRRRYNISELLHCAMYCNRSCLFVCEWVSVGVCLWVCYHDNSNYSGILHDSTSPHLHFDGLPPKSRRSVVSI